MADKIAQGKTAGVFKGKSRGKAVVTGGPGSAARVVGLLGGMYLPMQELAQTSGNLTETSSNLYELVQSRNLVAYPDEQIRTCVAQAVAVESSRGWRIAKEKASHKIDFVIALAMAASVCVAAQKSPPGRLRVFTLADGVGGCGGVELDPKSMRPLPRLRLRDHIRVVRVREKDIPAVRGPH